MAGIVTDSGSPFQPEREMPCKTSVQRSGPSRCRSNSRPKQTENGSFISFGVPRFALPNSCLAQWMPTMFQLNINSGSSKLKIFNRSLASKPKYITLEHALECRLVCLPGCWFACLLVCSRFVGLLVVCLLGACLFACLLVCLFARVFFHLLPHLLPCLSRAGCCQPLLTCLSQHGRWFPFQGNTNQRRPRKQTTRNKTRQTDKSTRKMTRKTKTKRQTDHGADAPRPARRPAGEVGIWVPAASRRIESVQLALEWVSSNRLQRLPESRVPSKNEIQYRGML